MTYAEKPGMTSVVHARDGLSGVGRAGRLRHLRPRICDRAWRARRQSGAMKRLRLWLSVRFRLPFAWVQKKAARWARP